MKKLSLLLLLLCPISQAAEFDAASLYSKLTSEFEQPDDRCGAKADVWAYELEQLTGQTVYKVLMLYPKNFRPNSWNFHVAPVVKMNGKWIVFEKANGITEPKPVTEWMKQINSGRACAYSESVSDETKNGFVPIVSDHSGRSLYEYQADRVSGACTLYLVDREMHSPGDGFLNYSPVNAFKSIQFGFKRALDACISIKPKPTVEASTRFCEDELNRLSI